ncbi:sporulation protein Cse60 [Priestia filamentosa]|uniref:sporulation protein Cse60 n=1 Tax=Priestia filamentosa TaxID=1402861 RepID=UPI001FB318C3|nr:sporulation protein Cse60 [Priestia filamentosa]MED3725692.1 sporulation protein Cse60 [Priestia filamentosa]UOE61070.1 sporulation protein Cse60 [Priestia filamentosa]
MKVKIFDKEHEGDLEEAINRFLKSLSDEQIIDIKYNVATAMTEKDQVYCFSALVMYKKG